MEQVTLSDETLQEIDAAVNAYFRKHLKLKTSDTAWFYGALSLIGFIGLVIVYF